MFLALDIGGTNTRIALSSDLEEILSVEKFKTGKELSSFIGNIETASIKVINGKCNLQEIKGISVGIAGVLTNDRRVLVQSPNLPFLNSQKLKTFFPWLKTSAVVIANNDSTLAALGEAVYGSGAKYKSVAYISLGTGVGGSLIHNKMLSYNQKIFEPGHQVINFKDGYFDGSGVAGSAETYLSGRGFFRVHKIDPHECRDPKIWENYGEILGVVAINIACMWSPDVIVIGGGMADHYDEFIGGVQNKLDSTSLTNKPIIIKNTFGDGSALIAGFHLLKSELKNEKYVGS